MSDPYSDKCGSRRRRRGSPSGTSIGGQTMSHRKTERDAECDFKGTTATQLTPTLTRTIILAKPQHGKKEVEDRAAVAIKQVDKAIIMVKTREDSKLLLSPSSTQNMVTGAESVMGVNPSYRIQKNMPARTHSPIPLTPLEGLTPRSRLALHVQMSQSMKLVDDSMQWCEAGVDVLLDQTDYLVIGVVGLQGVGKSTILSMLAGSNISDPANSFIFKPQAYDVRDTCSHQTSGVDMYVTSNRIILLDCQPVLSPSILDSLSRPDKKFPNEYSTAENYHEMQSLQLTAFLYTVCHVVLVVLDWFADPYLLKFLQTAEMLKPPTPSVGHESSPSVENAMDYYPHMVFLQNKGRCADFTVKVINTIQATIAKMFVKSRLKFRGGCSIANSDVLASLNPRTIKNDVNFYILPWIENQSSNSTDAVSIVMPKFKGHPSFEFMMTTLRNQLYLMARSQLTHATLTERNWFHYAARTWEAVRKSQLFLEYNRLLP